MGGNALAGRSGAMPSSKTRTTVNTRSRPKGNTSILNFFSKSDAPRSRQSRITEFGVKTSRSASNTGNGQPKTKSRSSEKDDGLFFGDKKSRTSSTDTREQLQDAQALPDDNVETPPVDVLNENWRSQPRKFILIGSTSLEDQTRGGRSKLQIQPVLQQDDNIEVLLSKNLTVRVTKKMG